VEISHARTNAARLNWMLSQVRIEPVTEHAARASAALLKQAGLHGRKYAIDATQMVVRVRRAEPQLLALPHHRACPVCCRTWRDSTLGEELQVLVDLVSIVMLGRQNVPPVNRPSRSKRW
jgi:hypothetical protein